ncbi:MAG TPA: hypothetical protein VMN35_02935 [Gaiellaceae bacterium]|nr:hypothetical protein [Gaiellaceae bacterium]
MHDDGVADAVLGERLETLASWIGELDTRVRAAELAGADEKTAKELRKAVEAIAKHDPKFQDKLQNHVDVLSDRVASLAGTVSTATAALAGKDGEIAGLRRELAEANARIETLATEARAASRPVELDDLRRAVAQLSSERESRPSDKRLARIEDKVVLLTERLDTVSSTVSTATASIVGREGELTALRRRLDEDATRLGAAVAELRQTIDPTPVLELRSTLEALARQAATLEQETRRGLVALGVDVEGITSRMGAVDASLAELADLRQVVERSDQNAIEVGSDLGRVRDEIAGVAGKLDALAAIVDAAPAMGPGGSEIAAVVTRFEAGCTKVDSLVRDLQEALETRPPAIAEPALGTQVETIERRLAELADEIAVVAAHDESHRLVALLDGLRMRVAATEQELAALSGSHNVLARLDVLTERLGALESGARALEETDALLPVAGEGRFRVELRSLELRMEHTEAAARESREAVLAQLERLASRMESRLRRLEEPQPTAYPQAVPEGQVIPIRTGEA